MNIIGILAVSFSMLATLYWVNNFIFILTKMFRDSDEKYIPKFAVSVLTCFPLGIMWAFSCAML